MTATGGRGGIRLSWLAVANAATYQVEASDAQPGPFQAISTTPDTGVTDAPLRQGQMRWYRVAASNAAGRGPFSDPIPGVSLVYWDAVIVAGTESLQFSWPPLASAATYRVQCDGGAGARAFADTTSTSATLNGLLKRHHYECGVFGRATDGHQIDVTPAHDAVPLPPFPGIPFNLVATVRSRTIHLQWLAATEADVYDVTRGCAPSQTSFAALGSTAATTFVDEAPPEFTSCTYRVAARNDRGAGPANEWDVRTSGVPDQMNLLPATDTALVTTGEFVSRTFTASASGQLMGIEVSATLADPGAQSDLHDLEMILWDGPVPIATRGFALPQPPCCASAGLDGDAIGAGYVDFSAEGIHVSAGEELRLELRAQYFDNDFYRVATTARGSAGGALFLGGVSMTDRDLAFKTFVARSPAAPLPTPAMPGVASGIRAILVGWDAVPGATSYIVHRGTLVDPPQPIATTTQPYFVDRSLAPGWYLYGIQASRGTEVSGVSVLEAALVPSSSVDVHDLGDGTGSLRFGGPTAIRAGQTFVAGQNGTLVGIEVGLLEDDSLQSGATSFYGQISLRLFDADGTIDAISLGGSVFPLPTCCVAVPLDPDLLSSGWFPLGVPIKAGQRLTFELGGLGGGLYRVGYGADNYPDGNATSNGQTLSGDLSFKVIVE